MALDERLLRTLLASAQRGDATAAMRLGRHYAAQRDFERALRWFLAAADAGSLPAAVEVGFLDLRARSPAADPQRGLGYLQRAAAAGHPEAGLQLAKLMLEGRWLAFELEQLVEWIVRARAAALPEAVALDLLFPGGAGALDGALRDWFQATPLAINVLRAAPLLATVDGGLPEPACRVLRERARPLLQPALVYDTATGERVRDPTRSNSAANFGAPDLLTEVIEWRLLQCVDATAPLARSEFVSVLHYAVGQEYKPHRDYLNPGGQPDQFPPRGPGQRTRTAFAYLSTTAAGGETEFPLLGQRIEARAGRVVVFDNVDAAGRPDPSTLHAALPVLDGEKWLATLWLREGWVR